MSTHAEYSSDGYGVRIQHCEVCDVYLGVAYPTRYCEDHKSTPVGGDHDFESVFAGAPAHSDPYCLTHCRIGVKHSQCGCRCNHRAPDDRASATEPGFCTSCGAVETLLNKPTGPRDFSDIGESVVYPTGYGCELCS